jgi:hypothetical protein
MEELILLSNDKKDKKDKDYSPTEKEKRQFKKDKELDLIEDGEPETIRVKVDKDGFYSLS